MSLVKFNRNRFPWNTMDRLDTVDFFSSDFFTEVSNWPAMNVKEHDDDFEIELAIPGFNKEDLTISIKDRTLEISAERREKDVEEDKDYTRKEFNYSSFKKSMYLPDTVDESKNVKATYTNGILTLSFQKKTEVIEKPKKVITVH